MWKKRTRGNEGVAEGNNLVALECDVGHSVREGDVLLREDEKVGLSG